MLTLLMPAEIASDWERLGAILAPAIARDDQRQDADVYRDLMAGDMAMFSVDLGATQGLVVIEFRDGVCWLLYVAGRAGNLWRRARPMLAYFEAIARGHGCTEMRMEGRDWSRLLPDYERLAERPGRNELRKAL